MPASQYPRGSQGIGSSTEAALRGALPRIARPLAAGPRLDRQPWPHSSRSTHRFRSRAALKRQGKALRPTGIPVDEIAPSCGMLRTTGNDGLQGGSVGHLGRGICRCRTVAFAGKFRRSAYQPVSADGIVEAFQANLPVSSRIPRRRFGAGRYANGRNVACGPLADVMYGAIFPPAQSKYSPGNRQWSGHPLREAAGGALG